MTLVTFVIPLSQGGTVEQQAEMSSPPRFGERIIVPYYDAQQGLMEYHGVVKSVEWRINQQVRATVTLGGEDNGSEG